MEGVSATEGKFETVSGHLYLTNATFSTLDTETVSGNAVLKNITANKTDMTAVSGKITAENLTSNFVKTESVSGKTELSGSFNDVTNNAVSGNVIITSAVCPKKIDAETVSGKVDINIPENDGFICELESVSGDVDTDFQANVRKKTVIYKEAAATFDVETVSGNVFIKRTDS